MSALSPAVIDAARAAATRLLINTCSIKYRAAPVSTGYGGHTQATAVRAGNVACSWQWAEGEERSSNAPGGWDGRSDAKVYFAAGTDVRLQDFLDYSGEFFEVINVDATDLYALVNVRRIAAS